MLYSTSQIQLVESHVSTHILLMYTTVHIQTHTTLYKFKYSRMHLIVINYIHVQYKDCIVFSAVFALGYEN